MAEQVYKNKYFTINQADGAYGVINNYTGDVDETAAVNPTIEGPCTNYAKCLIYVDQATAVIDGIEENPVIDTFAPAPSGS